MNVRGFTLAELLIALAILGVIATFTIPKVLQSQTSSQWKSVSKEMVATLSEAYQSYKRKNQITSGTSTGDITAYLNYVKIDTVSVVDGVDNGSYGPISCGSDPNGAVCLDMHNGGVLIYWPLNQLCGITVMNALPYQFDPDGKLSSSNAVGIYIYADGKVRTSGTIEPNTNTGWNGSCEPPNNPNPALDPTWFNWN